MSATIDPSRCPICGSLNQCQVVQGKGNCWCFSHTIPDEVLQRIPEEAREHACVCESCASGRKTPSQAFLRLQEILRGRG